MESGNDSVEGIYHLFILKKFFWLHWKILQE